MMPLRLFTLLVVLVVFVSCTVANDTAKTNNDEMQATSDEDVQEINDGGVQEINDDDVQETKVDDEQETNDGDVQEINDDDVQETKVDDEQETNDDDEQETNDDDVQETKVDDEQETNDGDVQETTGDDVQETNTEDVRDTNVDAVYPSPVQDEKESDYWLKLGREEIEEALHKPKLTNVAKNVILFLGDGMGVTVSTAGRIYKGQKHGHSGEEGYLVWERFPNMALLKTYNLDKQVPDSAATATAYLCGIKANYYTLGVNGNVKRKDCLSSLKEENRAHSILEWAMDADKETGFVTSTQVTHATPAALYAKLPERKWQCDRKLKQHGEDALKCKDIARQLVEDEPGRNIKVIMGGGRQEMGAPEEEDAKDDCKRTDGMNLVKDWMEDKEERGKTHAYVTTTRELNSVDAENTDYIMGLFGDVHIPYEVDKNTSLDGAPRMKEMVEVAIKRLRRNDNGFFLLVEGGRIDKGLHNTMPKRALEELLAFEEAVELALKMVDLEETLIVVTADHSHVMTINGYPQRGNNILGFTKHDGDVSDGLPYTTLMFTNGPGFSLYYEWNGKEVVRKNLTGVDTADKEFMSPSAVPTYEDSETHGGEDVAAFALGPMGHLFHRVHEQSYVAHVMGYSACIGPYEDCDRPVKIPANVYKPIRDQLRRKINGASSSSSVSCLSICLMAVIQIIQILCSFRAPKFR